MIQGIFHFIVRNAALDLKVRDKALGMHAAVGAGRPDKIYFLAGEDPGEMFFEKFLESAAILLALPAFVTRPLKSEDKFDRAERSYLAQRISAICTAFRAAPLRIWSPATKSQSP